MTAECEIIIQIINFIISNEIIMLSLFGFSMQRLMLLVNSGIKHIRTSTWACTWHTIAVALALLCICNGFCFAIPTGKLNFPNGRSEGAQRK